MLRPGEADAAEAIGADVGACEREFRRRVVGLRALAGPDHEAARIGRRAVADDIDRSAGEIGAVLGIDAGIGSGIAERGLKTRRPCDKASGRRRSVELSTSRASPEPPRRSSASRDIVDGPDQHRGRGAEIGARSSRWRRARVDTLRGVSLLS